MFLIIYYYCILKFNWKEHHLKKKYEPYVHATALTYAFGTAFAGLGLNLFNPSWIWCWIEPYPWDCEQSFQNGGETTCLRGDNAYIYQYAFFVIIPYITIFTSIVMFALTYRLVRKQENSTMKFSQLASRNLAVSVTASTTSQQGEDATKQSKSIKKSSMKAFRRKSKAVKETASLYLFFFFLTWSPTFSALILKHTVKSENGQKLAQEINGLFIAFLLPLQGFFNVLIYLRPRYKKLKVKMSSGGSKCGLRIHAFIAAFKRPLSKDSMNDGDEYLGTGRSGKGSTLGSMLTLNSDIKSGEESQNRRSTMGEREWDDEDDCDEDEDEFEENKCLPEEE